jgi:diguanylate cyclase (GGDEF)-like protein
MQAMASGAPSGRVLFADDDAEVRSAVARCLRRCGLIVDLARDGREALALASEYPYSVVATDQIMPGLSGIDLLQQLQPIQPDATFVMLTGSLESAAIFKRVPFVTAVLPKPWDDATLARTVEHGVELAEERAKRRRASTQPAFSAPGKFALLLEDSETDAFLLQQALKRGRDDDFRVVRATTLGQARELLSTRSYDVIFADFGLPDAQGEVVLRELSLVAPDTPILVVTGEDNEGRALSSVQSGAQDYLVKGSFDADKIQRAAEHAIERKRLERRLVQLAHFDALTGLANRVLLTDRLHGALARAERNPRAVVGLLYVDLDGFKLVNDRFGHERGDQLLILVAQRLCASARLEDTVARLGGDEFAVMLDGLSETGDARSVAQRVLNAFATPIVIDGKEMPVTASIGVAFFPADGQDLDSLFRAADTALYQAKKEGKDCYRFFSEELQAREATRQKVELELRQAVASIRAVAQEPAAKQRFRLVLQERHELSCDRVCGYHAGLSWTDEQGSLRPARELGALCEEVGAIEPVASWMLDAVCALLGSNHPASARVVSLNVPARELLNTSFADVVEAALARHAIAPERLLLEVAEAELGDASEEQVAALGRLARRGVRLGVCGFGSALSSLFHLARLPITSVKLSVELTARLGEPALARALRALVAAATVLDWRVVASAVDSQEQLQQLRELGCGEAQGRLWGEAVVALGE